MSNTTQTGGNFARPRPLCKHRNDYLSSLSFLKCRLVQFSFNPATLNCLRRRLQERDSDLGSLSDLIDDYLVRLTNQ